MEYRIEFIGFVVGFIGEGEKEFVEESWVEMVEVLWGCGLGLGLGIG